VSVLDLVSSCARIVGDRVAQGSSAERQYHLQHHGLVDVRQLHLVVAELNERFEVDDMDALSMRRMRAIDERSAQIARNWVGLSDAWVGRLPSARAAFSKFFESVD
jgi:hypothetical protein